MQENKPEINRIQAVVSASPHLKTGESIPRIMYSVLIALIPASIAAVYLFKLPALMIMLTAMVSAVLFEFGIQKIFKRKTSCLDGSALITGLLLALNLPPGIPLWMVVIGVFVAIFIGKQVFGGLGHNIFNPALVGRVFLVVSFPQFMTSWINPVDATTSATPLALMKLQNIPTAYLDLFLGNIGGCIGETSALALIIGAAFLFYKKYISWHIPVSYIGTVGLLTFILGQDPLFHILSGGLMLAALFMATDMVTGPLTGKGKIVFGLGAGLITTIIRLYGGLPEGVSFSILIMNGFTPLLDRYLRPRRFGKK